MREGADQLLWRLESRGDAREIVCTPAQINCFEFESAAILYASSALLTDSILSSANAEKSKIYTMLSLAAAARSSAVAALKPAVFARAFSAETATLPIKSPFVAHCKLPRMRGDALH